MKDWANQLNMQKKYRFDIFDYECHNPWHTHGITFCLGYCMIAFNENDAFAANGKAFQLGNVGGIAQASVNRAVFKYNYSGNKCT